MGNYKLDNYKVVFGGTIKNISPLIIGSGDNSETDSDVLKDHKGNPYISGSSLAGILRHHFENYYKNYFNIEKYFGYSTNDEGNGSKILFSDITTLNSEAKIQIRDGIRVNERGIAEDRAKFDYEVIEPNAQFDFKIEISSDNKDEMLKIIATLKRDIEDDRIKIGAKTNLGFGKIKIIQDNLSFYDLTNKSDIIKWLKKENNKYTDVQIVPFEFTHNDFKIDFYFVIKDSLIVKHYSTDPQAPDAEHFKSGDKHIIPGTSLKGAIRARGEKILNTLDIADKGRLIKYLFGDSQLINNNDNNNKNEEIKKNKSSTGSIPSRLQVSEVIIVQNAESSIQQRIKIDRFTNATINGALFDSMPLFAKDEINFNMLTLTIKNPTDAEIGLILLIIKDLWTEDLPVGGEKNIGRGVLKGKKAVITYKDLNIAISEDINKLSKEDKEKLQLYVDNLLNNQENIDYLNKMDNIYNTDDSNKEETA
ncbi:MAG: hypothetical protein EVG15_07650 [Candidatus Acididesulfobacter diazotrophicus]|uniref:CRISPR type III-associated protein domain-containing protein n=1 Tax=Candidatus Acididesulfobacter diazotrophicus TaxID=2597226 RepID=A0A519BLG2_9DELT|nr:MAG: hypothetical protein EVG15_07650 [Candidatus Acididesulfobacter diazotrophicus]